MGDMADDLIEQGLDLAALHYSGQCGPDPCPYCEEEDIEEHDMDTTQPPDGVKYDAAWAANRCRVENGSAGWQDFIQQAIDYAVAQAKDKEIARLRWMITKLTDGMGVDYIGTLEDDAYKATHYRQQAKESSHE